MTHPSLPLKSDLRVILAGAGVLLIFSVFPSAPKGTVLCRLRPRSHLTRLPLPLRARPWPGTRTRQNRPRRPDSREPPGRSLLKSPQWFRTAGLSTAIWQVSPKCQDRLPAPDLHALPLRGPDCGRRRAGLTTGPSVTCSSSGSALYPALVLAPEALLPPAPLKSGS